MSDNYAEWGTDTAPGDIPTLVAPFPANIIAFSVSYASTSSVNIGGGETYVMNVGVVTGTPPTTYTPFVATNITWDDTDDGTFPIGFVTGSLGAVSAGDRIAVRGLETGSITPTSGEVGVVVVFERTA
jgi:hypothetical protein